MILARDGASAVRSFSIDFICPLTYRFGNANPIVLYT